MSGNPTVYTVLVAFLLIPFALSAQAGSWEGRLQDGSRIQVDPNTNKATVYSKKGIVTPLWDGVHHLEDGSTIIIRKGIMVPNIAVMDHRRRVERAKPPAAEDGAPCRTLVRKVCGLHDECADHPACSPARQLLKMQREEESGRTPYSASPPLDLTTTQCKEALQDEEFFAPCTRIQSRGTPSPCERLIEKVCGRRGQCAEHTGCPLAKQLVEMELQDRRSSPNPDALTFTSEQCDEAFGDEELFPPCKR